jgi:hypothetical protein
VTKRALNLSCQHRFEEELVAMTGVEPDYDEIEEVLRNAIKQVE